MTTFCIQWQCRGGAVTDGAFRRDLVVTGWAHPTNALVHWTQKSEHRYTPLDGRLLVTPPELTWTIFDHLLVTPP